MGNPEPSLSKNRVEVECSICGKVKSINLFEFKKNTTGNFYKARKGEIRKRDNFTCQLCGVKENGYRLNAHHVDYDKKNTSPTNLISLCRPCHCKTNGSRKYYTDFFQTLLSRQEGATTIPQGSTPQANGGGSAEYPFTKMGNDIVCSSGKPEAVS
jgi:hypothetical protein